MRGGCMWPQLHTSSAGRPVYMLTVPRQSVRGIPLCAQMSPLVSTRPFSRQHSTLQSMKLFGVRPALQPSAFHSNLM